MNIRQFLLNETRKSYYKRIIDKVRKEDTIPKNRIHRPLQVSNPKVIVFGQDPYPSGVVEFGKYIEHYDGIAFSSRNTIKTPYSLKVLQRSFAYTSRAEGVRSIKISNDLSYLNDRGVILTNVYPTVKRGFPGSHPYWYPFSVNLVKYLDKHEILFILLGRQAQTLNSYIKRNQVIRDIHPAAIRYKSNDRNILTCFFKANKYLDEPILWTK